MFEETAGRYSAKGISGDNRRSGAQSIRDGDPLAPTRFTSAKSQGRSADDADLAVIDPPLHTLVRSPATRTPFTRSWFTAHTNDDRRDGQRQVAHAGTQIDHDETALLLAARDYAKRIDTSSSNVKSVLSKLIAIGGVTQEESSGTGQSIDDHGKCWPG